MPLTAAEQVDVAALQREAAGDRQAGRVWLIGDTPAVWLCATAPSTPKQRSQQGHALLNAHEDADGHIANGQHCQRYSVDELHRGRQDGGAGCLGSMQGVGMEGGQLRITVFAAQRQQ